MTKQTIQGIRILPSRIDVKVDGNWINGVDLAALPEGTKFTDIRQVLPVKKNRVYQSITEFVDGNQIISRATIPADDNPEYNAVQTVGLVGSPTSYTLYDSSPF